MPFIACYSVTIANRKRSPWFYLRDESAPNTAQDARRYWTIDAAEDALDRIRDGQHNRDWKGKVIEVRA